MPAPKLSDPLRVPLGASSIEDLTGDTAAYLLVVGRGVRSLDGRDEEDASGAM